ncbi:hypothetical protein [Limnohabitans sp. T6-20]|uniref:hypothetical protein n=1 Tax=Limnohabitans sp. T6-20 TaxID=1100725 RepID=UPI000D39AB1C|nr:hypothetical protein [Limnohabitans sp. T6-20]PUE10320.1 hypothetical protein B9Z33_09575 [Limnohabitans sp. T6-20]
MSLSLSIRVFEILLGWSLALQTLEYLRVQSLDRISVWPVLRQEIPARPAWIKALLDALFAPKPYIALLLLRLALAMALMFGLIGLSGAILLFLIALLLLLRWRGAFNGGSDFMTLVAISGLLLAHTAGALTDMSWGWRAGFWYISLQTISSYFVSGWVKLLRPEWRSGRAMTLFLDTGIYGPLPSRSIFRHPMLARVCSWSFTVWEGCFPLALLDVRLAWLFCAVAALFHFLVFVFFGLNRFFWAWIATFPAVLYCAGATW